MNKCLVILAAAALAAGNQDESPSTGDKARRLRNTEFFRAQRAEEAHASQVQRKAAPARSDKMLGITLWRLRAPRAADRARLLVHEQDKEEAREWTPERISLDTRLSENDRVRISIESTRHGYLYVASRERFADNTEGPAYLIFPSRRISGGQNKVRPGQLVDIPEANNRRPYLTLKRSKPGHIGESLIVVVSPAPIDGLIVANAPLQLSESHLGAWRKYLTATTKIAGVAETAGQPWTASEQSASQQATLLRVSDPAPQTIYKVNRNSRHPLIVDLLLKLSQ